jgi:hypothetical protein
VSVSMCVCILCILSGKEGWEKPVLGVPSWTGNLIFISFFAKQVNIS